MVEAIELFMTNPAPDVEKPVIEKLDDEEPVDLSTLNLNELHEFAYKNQLDGDAFLDDKVELKKIIEQQLPTADGY